MGWVGGARNQTVAVIVPGNGQQCRRRGTKGEKRSKEYWRSDGWLGRNLVVVTSDDVDVLGRFHSKGRSTPKFLRYVSCDRSLQDTLKTEGQSDQPDDHIRKDLQAHIPAPFPSSFAPRNIHHPSAWASYLQESESGSCGNSPNALPSFPL